MKIHKILIMSSLLLGLALGAGRASNPGPPPSIPFTIRTHGVQLTAQDAAVVIAKGNKILQRAGSTVPVSLTSFTNGGGSGIVSTSEELNALFADTSANVHIVKEIDFCGSKVVSGTIAGCSGTDKPIVALAGDVSAHPENVRLTAVQWMHELGHRKGLCHSSEDGALMAPTPGAGNTGIDECEINAFIGRPIPAACTASCSGPQQAKTAVEYVRRGDFIEGIPYEEGSRYTTAQDVTSLIGLLSDAREHKYWTNAIAVLGMSGDLQAFKPMQNFLESDKGPLSPEIYSAKMNVPLALGHLLAKTKNPDILKYLKDGLHPSAWSNKVKWHSSSPQDDAALNSHLTTMAILGLGLSGNVEGQTALGNLLNEIKKPETKSLPSTKPAILSMKASSADAALHDGFEEKTAGVIDEALKINAHVKDKGLSSYYHGGLPGHNP